MRDQFASKPAGTRQNWRSGATTGGIDTEEPLETNHAETTQTQWLAASRGSTDRLARVVEKVNAEAEQMSHRGVEVVLGRLATDEAWRERFRQAPAAALRELARWGLELSAVELAAIEGLDPSAVLRFAESLDPRLQKAVLVAPEAGESSVDHEREEA